MDGSEIPRPYLAARLARSLLLLLLLLLLCLFVPPQAAAQNEQSHSSPASSAPAQKETRKGTFLGQVIDIDEETSTITVKPADPRLRLKRFFYDKATVYVSDGKKATFDDLYLGDKVAVRWFSEDWIHIAEKVYIVFGEFKPEEYEDKPKEPKTKEAGKGKSH